MNLAQIVEAIMRENGLTDCKGKVLKDENQVIVRGNLENNHSLTFKPISCELNQGFQTVLRDKRDSKASVIWFGVDSATLPHVIKVAKFQINGIDEQRPSRIIYTMAIAVTIGIFILGFGIGTMTNRDCSQNKNVEIHNKTV